MVKQLLGRVKTGLKTIGKQRLDAHDLLRKDHVKIEIQLIRIRLTRDKSRRDEVFSTLRNRLEKHMRVEEEIYYPSCSKIRTLGPLIHHSRADHELIKDSLEDLALMDATSFGYAQLLTRLILDFERHVIEEENAIFDRASKLIPLSDYDFLSIELRDAFSNPNYGAAEHSKRTAA